MKNKKDTQPRINDLPAHLRGPRQNRYGGHRTQRLRGFPNQTFGAASEVYVFTAEQRERLARKLGLV